MRTIITTLSLIVLASAAAVAQVSQAWQKQHSSNLQFVDYSREIGTDAAGNVYIGGHSLINEDQEGVTTIVKYDSSGNKKWVYSSLKDDLMEDMVVAPSGAVYYAGVAGISPATNDFLIVKVSSAGKELWRKTFNGPGNYYDYGNAICIDAAENVYVGGNASTVVNGQQFTAVKYDSAGTQKWSAAFPSFVPSYQNDCYDIVADGSGNVFLSGYQKVGDNHFLTMVKFNNAGAMQWWDTTDTHNEWNSVCHTFSKADNAGNVYLLGNTILPATGCDLLLIKYAPGGRQWLRTWNNPGNDSNYVNNNISYTDEALVIDGSGSVFVSGTTSIPGTPYRDDIVTLKYNPSGNLLWSHTYNSSDDEEDIPFSIALDGAGNAYVCGSTSTSSAFGDIDFLTYKLNGATGALAWQQTFDYVGNFIDEAHALCVDAKNNVYVTGPGAANASILDPEAHMVTIRYRQVSGTISTGIVGAESLQSPSVAPNPAHDAATILIEAKQAGSAAWTLSNAVGQTVANASGLSISAGRRSFLLPVATLPAGMYMLSVSVDGFVTKQRVTVQH